MNEIRFHGRGGQGAVTSAELLARAAINENRFAQAFPSFGPERRGAPAQAFARVSDYVIRNKTAIISPTAVVVLDQSLLDLVKVTDGLVPGGTLVVNSTRDLDALQSQFGTGLRLAVVDANRIAREEIGSVITNTTMLGALLAASPIVFPESIEEEIRRRFYRSSDQNCAAFRRAFESAAVQPSQLKIPEFEQVCAVPV
ncbi:MAG: 2-oxoacid:acceptor oxidoreductase family protein [Acidobacteriota bacterium]|nr:2-oxoacid:acceptor oxidoreductase family protein [Acidobacteriota bacterium]